MFLKRLTNQNFIICKLLVFYIYNNIILYNILHNNKARRTQRSKSIATKEKGLTSSPILIPYHHLSFRESHPF